MSCLQYSPAVNHRLYGLRCEILRGFVLLCTYIGEIKVEREETGFALIEGVPGFAFVKGVSAPNFSQAGACLSSCQLLCDMARRN